MKRNRLISPFLQWSLLFLGLLPALYSCQLSDLDIVSRGESQWVVPIAKAEISVMDLLEKRQAKEYLQVSDQKIVLSYTFPQPMGFDLKQIISTQKLQWKMQCKVPQEGYPVSATIPSGAVVQLQNLLPPFSKSFGITLPNEIVSYQDFIVDLDFDIEISNNPGTVNYQIEFTNVKDNEGNPVKIFVLAGQKTTRTEVSIRGAHLPASVDRNVTINYTVRPLIQSIPQEIEIRKGEGIDINLTLKHAALIRFAGVTQPTTQDFRWKGNELDNIRIKGLSGLHLHGCTLLLDVESRNLKLPLGFTLNYKANLPNGTQTGQIVRNDLEIDSSRGATQKITLQGEDIDQLASYALMYPVEVACLGAINPNSKELSLSSESALLSRATLQQELNLSIQDYEVKDTIPNLNLSDIDSKLDMLGNLALNLHSVSTLPIDMKCKSLKLLDAQGNAIPNGTIDIVGAILGSTDGTTPKESTLTVRFPKEKLSVLKTAKKMEFVFVVGTAENKVLRITPSQKLRFSVSLATNQQF